MRKQRHHPHKFFHTAYILEQQALKRRMSMICVADNNGISATNYVEENIEKCATAATQRAKLDAIHRNREQQVQRQQEAQERRQAAELSQASALDEIQQRRAERDASASRLRELHLKEGLERKRRRKLLSVIALGARLSHWTEFLVRFQTWNAQRKRMLVAVVKLQKLLLPVIRLRVRRRRRRLARIMDRCALIIAIGRRIYRKRRALAVIVDSIQAVIKSTIICRHMSNYHHNLVHCVKLARQYLAVKHARHKLVMMQFARHFDQRKQTALKAARDARLRLAKIRAEALVAAGRSTDPLQQAASINQAKRPRMKSTAKQEEEQAQLVSNLEKASEFALVAPYVLSSTPGVLQEIDSLLALWRQRWLEETLPVYRQRVGELKEQQKVVDTERRR